MPLEVATGPITLPEKYLAAQIAATAAGRLLLGGAPDPDSALLRIHFDSLPKPRGGTGEYERKELQEYRPYIVVCTNPREGWAYGRQAFGTFAESGSLILEVEKGVPDDKEWDLAENMRKFKNELGALAREVTELAGQSDYLDITRMALLTLIQSDRELASAEGNFLMALVRVDYGVR